MRFYLTLLFSLLSFVYLHAQEFSQKLDSLLHETELAESDTSLANSYLALAEFFKYSNPDSTLKYVGLVKSVTSATNFPKGIARAAGYEAGVYFLRGDYKRVTEIAREGLKILENQEGLEKLKSDLLRIIGISYGASGNYDLSLKFFLDTKKVYETLQDSASIILTLNNIGVVHIKLNNFKEALDIFLELDRIADFKNPNNVTIPVNLGFIYYELNEYEKAKEQLLKALNYPGEVDRRAYGLSYFKLGEIYSKERNFSDAINAFDCSIQIYDEMKNELEKVQSLNGLARVFLEMSNWTKAEAYSNEALEISKRFNGLPEKRTSLETLYLISKEHNQPAKALDYFEQLQVVSDSLQNAEVNAEIGRLTAEYEFYQQQNELLIQQKEQELKSQAQINRQKILLIGSIIILGLALLLIVFMYRTNLDKKTTNKLLSHKNKEIEDKAEKLEQSNSVKNRLFSILAHDLRGPLSSLYGAFTLIEMNAASKEDLDKIIPEVARRFKYTSTLLNNLLQWSQSQMEGYKVIPSAFDIVGLLEEKKILLQTKIDEKSISLILSTGEYFVYADRNMIDLVLQNLIANAIKYCNERGEIIASITDKDGKALVTISDNGIGIEPDKIEKLFSDEFYTTEGTNSEKGTGLGLMLCKDFVQRNGGNIWVESKAGEGSTFFFTLPHP